MIVKVKKVRRTKKPNRKKRKQIMAKHLADKSWLEIFYITSLNKPA